MSLIKTKHESELFEFYKKYLNDPKLITDEVIDSYKIDVAKVKKEKKFMENHILLI